MKTLIVYFSMGGRTKMTAELIAEVIGLSEVHIEQLKYPDKISSFMKDQEELIKGNIARLSFDEGILDLSQYNRIIFGTPTYGSRPSAAFNGFVKNCIQTDGKEWILFATCRMIASKIFDRMKQEIEVTNGNVVKKKLFKGFFRLNKGQIRKFGEELK